MGDVVDVHLRGGGVGIADRLKRDLDMELMPGVYWQNLQMR